MGRPREGSSGHPAALIRAAKAGLRALLTMRVLVLCTFIATGLADIGASCADRFGELTAPGHETSGHPANGSTVDIEPDAARHHLHIVFLQAGGGAVVARIGAGVTGVDTGSVLLMSHGLSPTEGGQWHFDAWCGAGVQGRRLRRINRRLRARARRLAVGCVRPRLPSESSEHGLRTAHRKNCQGASRVGGARII